MSHYLPITPSGSSEGLCLFLDQIRDGLEGVALLELLGKWMLCPWLARLFGVLPQGRLEECFKVRGLGCGLVTHIASGRGKLRK